MNWHNFKKLRKYEKTVQLLVVLLFFVSMQAMEDWFDKKDNVEQPLLEKHDQENDADTQQADSSLLHALNKESPYLLARVFSLFPGNNPELNYLMRLDWFQPTDPIESSPFYPIVEEMREAHMWHIINACKKNWRQHSNHSALYAARKALIIDEVFSFMKMTHYNKANKKVFNWTDAQELNELVPKYTPHSDDLCLEPEKIKNVLARYHDQTQKKLNTIRYAYSDDDNKKENIVNAGEYLKFRIDLLYKIKKRAHKYPFIEDTGVLENATKCKWAALGLTGISAVFAIPINYVYFTHDAGTTLPTSIPVISGIAFIGSLVYDGVVCAIINTNPTCVTHKRNKKTLKQVISLFSGMLEELQTIRPIAPGEQV